MERIPISGPWITQKEIDYVADAAANAWYENANVYHHRFEKAFADYLGVRHAIALPSCTSAIHLSLLACNIGPGDEVIVPDLTWIASAAPVTYVRAATIFADVDRETWCLSAAAVERCLTRRTRAVIAVDLYGGMPEFDALRDLASRHGLLLIEDAAEAVGSEYKGKRAGSLGHTGVFSFHGTKTLTTGEGGMLLTDREEIYKRALVLRDHGRPPGDTMLYNTEVAYKYKMSSMQAALGLAQLERIEELIERKREIFAWYCQELQRVEGIILNPEPPGTKSTYCLVTIVVDPVYKVSKLELIRLLDKQGIATRPFFHPLSSIPAYRETEAAWAARERNKTSYDLSLTGINLPSALNLTPAKVKRVCDALKRILEQYRVRAVPPEPLR